MKPKGLMKLNVRSRIPLGLLLAWAVPVSAVPPEKPLLPQATRVIALEDQENHGGLGAMQVASPWLSDHELLHIHRKALYLYDTTAHTDTALPKLTYQVKSSNCPIAFLTAAPGAPWVMWGQSANSPIYVASVDGLKRWQWPSDGGMTMPYWCADGQRLIQFVFSGDPKTVHYTDAYVNDVHTPTQSKMVGSLPPGFQSLEVLVVVSEHHVVARTPDPVTFGNSKPLPKSVQKMMKKLKKADRSDGTSTFTFTEQITTRNLQDITVWDLDVPTPLHRYAVSLPAQAQEVAVSPQGDRVAWLLMPSKSRGRAVPTVSLWVSGLDGTSLREIGSVRWTSQSQMGDIPTQVHWLPGGKRLGFIYGNSLWTVPAV
jgi:hypothetical protein